MPTIQHEPRQLLVGAALMLVTGVVQTFGVVMLQEYAARAHARSNRDMTRMRMLVILSGVIFYLFALHILEMSLWAVLYRFVAGYTSFASALYESALAFTTMDTADLPPQWTFLSAAEAITGLLMFAWSTSVLFNQTQWVTEARREYWGKHHPSWSRHRETPSGP